MHKEILSEEQIVLLPLVKEYSRKFYLVGGTAIALHIGHRRSIDFDLFSIEKLNSKLIKSKLFVSEFKPVVRIFEAEEQLHYLINGVKFTFFNFNFPVPAELKFEKIVRIPTLLDLAAMKAFALGGRNKWKDYVDLFFILKNFHSFNEIAVRAKELFSDQFNPKLFKVQISYFKDINYDEQVTYMKGFEVTEEEVKSFLTKVATEPF
jgi:hypothetical protein